MSLHEKINALHSFKDSLSENLIGIEKEGLRVAEDGSIAQSPHPESYGSALTHPEITTDFSEALVEIVTSPTKGANNVIDELAKINHYIYHHLPHTERFWPASMPCILRGKTNIPIAYYGESNLGKMKTVYRRGLANRYGSVMQAIAGIHFNYSFSLEFWESYLKVMASQSNVDSKQFISHHYMGLTRNILRYGWLVTYLFGASASVCKSFMHDYHDHNLEEFDDNTFYLPYATSLRMGDIGYQNSQEDKKGVKANYNSLHQYIYSLRAAMQTSCEDFEAIGVKKDEEYLQLNTSILQIANEYYSSVRPKPIIDGSDRPLAALLNDGIGYIELRSLDVNPLMKDGIDEEQVQFLESFMLYCLLEDSPTVSTAEINDIDINANLVAHRGREPGLHLKRYGEDLKLKDWGKAILKKINDCAVLLSKNHQKSVNKISRRIDNPDLTPSAQMLNEMKLKEKGFFEYTDQFSRKYQKLYKDLKISDDYFAELDKQKKLSNQKQLEIESEDRVCFDQFLVEYFSSDS
ncbi:MAG: glutamate--cysteine ligase [Pseudomonadota bacterium]|nr:glutamate--cysteine ligase [Pseudomonadota bacterium]